MPKEIKDYLHLYLGCEMRDLKGYHSFKLTADNLSEVLIEGFLPALRPLSDITPSEHTASSVCYTTAFSLVAIDKSEWVKEWHGEAARSNYLRSVNIDIDGLIESGLAIDKTKTP